LDPHEAATFPGVEDADDFPEGDDAESLGFEEATDY
jgi:hypothetical protein